MSSQKHRSQIGEGGRRLLFVGLAVLPMSVLTYALSTTPLERLLERALGTTGLGCFIYGTFMVFVVLSMLLYNHIPQRLIIPLGAAGWMLSFLLLYWLSWGGSGASKL